MIMTNRASLALVATLSLLLTTSSAFLTSSFPTKTASMLRISSNPYAEGDQLMDHRNDDDNDSDEKIRERLEQILSMTPSSSSSHATSPNDEHDDGTTHQDANNEQQQQHILTAHRERIYEMELHLLESLADSDEGIDTLVNLWVGEHGEEASNALHQMETYCSKGLVLEEELLRNMIEQHGHEWAEPASRLAVLLFTRGQYEEAVYWCHAALCVKPWHFETGQLLVALWLRQEDLPMAVRAARECTIPNLNAATDHKARRAWVAKHCATLQARLQQSRRASAEMHHDEFFGDEECLDEYCWT